jgi:CheY-like chemotaxis protein
MTTGPAVIFEPGPLSNSCYAGNARPLGSAAGFGQRRGQSRVGFPHLTRHFHSHPRPYTVLQMAALAALLGGSLMPDSRILVVEDEPTSREIVDFVLCGAGYGVDMAATAAAALMLLSSTRYGLVVADWMLPDGDGIYIADRALALGSYTLIVTGHLADLPPRTGERHRLLSKPVKPAELIAVVRDIIGEPPVSS